MSLSRSTLLKCAAAGVVAAGALFGAASANAGVSWSLGINAPGIGIGVVEPGYYAPAPTYYAPPPTYYAPPPVYYRPAPVYRPAPIYYAPPVVYGGGYHGGRGDWRRHERHERREHHRDWR